ncbi:MAG: glycosyl hydrolase [Lewinellaceae bacterium]|nr:glycosyl hydrolase [Lewinellaceae bacterium]
MNTFAALDLLPAKGICYSGFREGQMPGGIYPSYAEVKEDLLLLQGHWKYLRLYDVDAHSETVLEVIRRENLDFKIMLGAFIEAEMNNFGCPWGGGVYTEAQLDRNRKSNRDKIQKLIARANQYPEIIFSLSVGNEACVDWTDHYVSVNQVVEYVQLVKDAARQPVTFCENYVPWLTKLKPLAAVVDFISIHTYPVWEYKKIHESLEYTKENYLAVANLYPGMPVVITEAGWATNSNGRGIDPEHVSEDNQKIYYNDLMDWSEKEGILTFFFEAFDESWKGSPEPLEPEKHWGVFRIDRSPKQVMEQSFNTN